MWNVLINQDLMCILLYTRGLYALTLPIPEKKLRFWGLHYALLLRKKLNV